MSLRERIADDMKAALRAGEKGRLSAIRLIMAGIKQIEVDSGNLPDETTILSLLDKMSKQRRESLQQFEAAGRADLAAQESLELEVIRAYMPQPLAAEAVDQLIAETVAALDAKGPADMGKVMAALRPKVQGRADMSQLSAQVKARLSAR